MRETSLDEFVDRGDGGDGEDDGGADDGSEDEATISPGDGGTEEESAAEGGSVAEHTEAADERDPDLEQAAEPEPEPEAEPEPEQEPDAAEPAVSTYDWTPSGADCEACGTAVERRWRDDALLVCAECKTW